MNKRQYEQALELLELHKRISEEKDPELHSYTFIGSDLLRQLKNRTEEMVLLIKELLRENKMTQKISKEAMEDVVKEMHSKGVEFDWFTKPYCELTDLSKEKYSVLVQAAIQALQKHYDIEEKWQSIDTAPKDGRVILVYNGKEDGYYTEIGQIGTARWCRQAFPNGVYTWCAEDCCDGVTTYEKATLWKPLPTPKEIEK